jgi:hypothetical protein
VKQTEKKKKMKRGVQAYQLVFTEQGSLGQNCGRFTTLLQPVAFFLKQAKNEHRTSKQQARKSDKILGEKKSNDEKAYSWSRGTNRT